MARRSLLLVSMVCLVVVSAVPARADDDGIHRTGIGRARTLTRWALGDSSNPLVAALEGDCGAVVDGRFFMAPPIVENLEVTCRVRHGLPIVFSHAAQFTWIPAYGTTDAEIIAAADALFTPITSWVRFDGDRVGVRNKTFNLGAFTVRSEAGSFYDGVIGLGTGAIRTSLTGTFLTIPPDGCGRHVLRSFVDFGRAGEVFGGTYHIRIVGCDDD
jgi:hypothetical protein